MSRLFLFPEAVILLINNYEPMTILAYEDDLKVDWKTNLERAFHVQYPPSIAVPQHELKMVYTNLARKEKTIFAGRELIIKLTDGSLLCYDEWEFCPITHYKDIDKNQLKIIDGIETNISQVSCSNSGYIYLLYSDGRLMRNVQRLTGKKHFLFEEVKKAPRNIIQIDSASNDYLLVLLSDGTVMGDGEYRHVYGLGDKFSYQHTLTTVPGVPMNISKVCASTIHSTLLLTDGTIMKINRNDEKGYGFFYKPGDVPTNIQDVQCSNRHSLILLRDGTVMGRGYNEYGQTGHKNVGRGKYSEHFTKIEGLPQNVCEIHCGGIHSVLKLTDGTIMSTGFTGGYEMPNTEVVLSFDDTILPFTVVENIPRNVAEIACGFSRTLVRLTDGKVLLTGPSYVKGKGFFVQTIYDPNEVIKRKKFNHK